MNLEETMLALSQSPTAAARRIGRMLATARSAAMRDDARAASNAADRIDRAAATLKDPTDAEMAGWAREHARDLANDAEFGALDRAIQRDEFRGTAAAAATRAARAAMARPYSGTAARLARVVAELAEIRAESAAPGVSPIVTACMYICDAISAQNAPGTLGYFAAALAIRDGLKFDAALAVLASENNLPADPALHVVRHDDGSIDRA